MKTWFEFPEDTRFARSGKSDILYTPIYFANENVAATFCVDDDWSEICDDYSQLDAKVRLVGKASLGFLSVAGRPVNSLNTQFALPSVGFRPIYTLTIMELERRIRLEERVDNRSPFEFRLQTSRLADLQQIASSLKTVSADTASTMNLFQDVSPALIVSVQYSLVGTIHYKGEKRAEKESEIRLFVSLDESQVPAMTPTLIGNNPLAELSQTVYLHLGKTKNGSKPTRRRDSLPLIRRMSRSSSSASVQTATSSAEEDSYLVVEIETTEPFCFRRRDEAAAAKITVKLTYHYSAGSTPEDDEDGLPPPKITGNATTLMKSLTSLTLEPIRPEGAEVDPSAPDDFFHLRSKIFPVKKNKLTFGDWEKTRLSPAAAVAAQDMLQGNGLSPTVEVFNSYRIRRASTVPTPQAIREEEPTAPLSTIRQQQEMTTPSAVQDDTAHMGQPISRAETFPTNTTAPPTPMTTAPAPRLTIPDPPRRWTTSAELWLTHPVTSTLTPSFTTPYINHFYTASINLSLNPDISSTSSSAKAKAFKTLKSYNPATKSSIDFNVPVSVRYDLGLVPSYEIDGTLPEYDFSLPGYDDAVGLNPGALESLQQPNEGHPDSDTGGGGNNLGPGNLTSPPLVMEEVAAYEARVTGSNARTGTMPVRGAGSSPGPSADNERHAWRFANINSNAHGDDADDDVLDMLMRNTRIGQGNQTTRRVYGDHTETQDLDPS